MKLAIVGSRSYSNLKRIAQLVDKYIGQYTAGNISIISGGCPNGADALAKEIALAKGLHYQEFAPIHQRHNQYCVFPPEGYNKAYHVRNFFERNTQIAEACDHLLAFIVKNVKAKGTMDTVGKAYHLKKQVFLFEDE